MDLNLSGVEKRRSLFVWALCCIAAGGVFIVYVVASLQAGQGELVMPLDDVYIHFQYARQMAAGQPYVYNPGLPPTSGATSFLYPWLLAIGYFIGFQGLHLGLWAMGLGALALAGSAWLVYRLMRCFKADWRLAALWATAFGLAGPVSWHFMSGMETGLVIFFALGLLNTLTPIPSLSEQNNNWQLALWAAGLALLRPEGGVMALLAVGAVWWQKRHRLKPVATPKSSPLKGLEDHQPEKSGLTRRDLWLLLSVLVIGVQPRVNLLVTGSAVASGNAAKSILGTVPFEWGAVIRRILENFARMWVEFFSGTSPREGMYFAPFWGLLALLGLGVLLSGRRRHVADLDERRQWQIIGLMLVAWLIAGTLAIATLDTAFWHFKRYQMPFMALLWVLAGWGLASIGIRKTERLQLQIYGIALVTMAVSLWTGAQFIDHYRLNVGYVTAQPLQMARWLQANTPPDAVVAVHDTGLLRYEGGRTTLDIVGLTTPGAADYWRNGPGAVAEFLMRERPDYIASFGDVHGFVLGILVDSCLYGEPLAGFPVTLDPNFNVALAADFQGIYQPEWDFIRSDEKSTSLQPFNFNYWGNGSLHTGSVDVADIKDEARAHYSWHSRPDLGGFPSEVRQMDYIDCAIDNCQITDGGRLITDYEEFNLWTYYASGSSWDVALVSRIHPASAGTLDIYVNGEFVDTQWIPSIPGKWLEIVTCVPKEIAGNSITNSMRVRIEPSISIGFYEPFYHWLYGCPTPDSLPNNTLTTFQSGAIVLADAAVEYQPAEAQMQANIQWYTDGSAEGDYKLFVHVLNEADEIVAQTDTYPGNGTLPPGNWLPGVLRDTITVNLSDVPAGRYRVAMGLYDPYTFERLQPESGDEQGRFFIGDVEIP